MAMQSGIGLSKIVFLVGAGYTGTILVKNNKLSELLGELQNLVKGLESSGDSANSDTDPIAAQVRWLAQEVRQLANTRQITVLNGGSGQTDYSSLILPAATLGALGYGYMWWKGLSISDLMYVTKRNMAAAVASLTENLQNVNVALEKAKKHLLQRVQNLDGKIDEQRELSKLIMNEKLLRDKGFTTCDHLRFDLASTSDSMDVNLDALLQIARIIHLNDVELYFSSVNVDSVEEYYSPRNELEALNSILSQVDLCLKINGTKNKAHLQNLRDAILKRIENFGNKNKKETRIVNGACDNENNLIKWAECSGVKSKLQIAYVEGAGRGALAKEDLGVGDIALEIPISVVISEELVYKSDMPSMRERHNAESNYKLYFDALPKEFNTGLSFGLDALMALDETLVSEEIFQAKEYIAKNPPGTSYTAQEIDEERDMRG